MVEVITRCGECGGVARYAAEARVPAELGEIIRLPAPHHGCGGQRGELVMQIPLDLEGVIQPLDNVLWPEYLPG